MLALYLYFLLDFGLSHTLSCLDSFPTLPSHFSGTGPQSNLNLDTDSLRKLTEAQEVFYTHQLIEIQRQSASDFTKETAESVTTTPPQNLMTVDVQALSTTISLAVTQVVQQVLGQVNKPPTLVATEKKLVDESVQDEFPFSSTVFFIGKILIYPY